MFTVALLAIAVKQNCQIPTTNKVTDKQNVYSYTGILHSKDNE
jgi:hypothetical protein